MKTEVTGRVKEQDQDIEHCYMVTPFCYDIKIVIWYYVNLHPNKHEFEFRQAYSPRNIQGDSVLNNTLTIQSSDKFMIYPFKNCFPILSSKRDTGC
ncbi:hypothetical protein NQ317_014043 [Molorchus minor]|uniref:Uncharacterized protein n=1 Tax=Molorchus minor TaxID=1323400 RepID=A0ABQ9JZR5_9CUCU|nr:hypothetical protein NQ317_014043 [Molorchus minor]